jgi:hypothetical protein
VPQAGRRNEHDEYNRMSDKNTPNISVAGTPAPVTVKPTKKKAPYPFWLGGVAASIAASITQCVLCDNIWIMGSFLVTFVQLPGLLSSFPISRLVLYHRLLTRNSVMLYVDGLMAQSSGFDKSSPSSFWR